MVDGIILCGIGYIYLFEMLPFTLAVSTIPFSKSNLRTEVSCEGRRLPKANGSSKFAKDVINPGGVFWIAHPLEIK